MVERLTVVVDAVLGILRNQLVTSSILVVRTFFLLFFIVFHPCSLFVVFAPVLHPPACSLCTRLITLLAPYPQLLPLRAGLVTPQLAPPVCASSVCLCSSSPPPPAPLRSCACVFVLFLSSSRSRTRLFPLRSPRIFLLSLPPPPPSPLPHFPPPFHPSIHLCAPGDLDVSE